MIAGRPASGGPLPLGPARESPSRAVSRGVRACFALCAIGIGLAGSSYYLFGANGPPAFGAFLLGGTMAAIFGPFGLFILFIQQVSRPPTVPAAQPSNVSTSAGSSASGGMMEAFDVAPNDATYRGALRPVFLTGAIGGPVLALIGIGAIYGGVSTHQLFIAGVGAFVIALGVVLSVMMRRSSRERLQSVEIEGPALALRGGGTGDFLFDARSSRTPFEVIDYRNLAGDPRRGVPFVFQTKGKSGGLSLAAAESILAWARTNGLKVTQTVRGQTVSHRVQRPTGPN